MKQLVKTVLVGIVAAFWLYVVVVIAFLM